MGTLSLSTLIAAPRGCHLLRCHLLYGHLLYGHLPYGHLPYGHLPYGHPQMHPLIAPTNLILFLILERSTVGIVDSLIVRT